MRTSKTGSYNANAQRVVRPSIADAKICALFGISDFIPYL